MLLQLYFCQQTEASVSRCFIYSQKSLFKALCEILDGSVCSRDHGLGAWASRAADALKQLAQ